MGLSRVHTREALPTTTMQGTGRKARTRKWGLLGMAVVVLMLVATMFVIVPTTASGLSPTGAAQGASGSTGATASGLSPSVSAYIEVGTMGIHGTKQSMVSPFAVPPVSPTSSHTFPLTYTVASSDALTSSNTWASPVAAIGGDNFIYTVSGDINLVNASSGTALGYGAAVAHVGTIMLGDIAWTHGASNNYALGAANGVSSVESFALTTTSIAASGAANFSGSNVPAYSYMPMLYNEAAGRVYLVSYPAIENSGSLWNLTAVTTAGSKISTYALGPSLGYPIQGASLNTTSGYADYVFIDNTAVYKPTFISRFSTTTGLVTSCHTLLSIGGDSFTPSSANGLPNGNIWLVGQTTNSTGWYAMPISDTCVPGLAYYLGPSSWNAASDSASWTIANGFLTSNTVVAMDNLTTTAATVNLETGWFLNPNTAVFTNTTTINLGAAGFGTGDSTMTSSGAWFALIASDLTGTGMDSYVYSLAAAPSPPPAPTAVVVSSITSVSASVSWTQSTGGGIVNNTVYLYAGSTCGGTPSVFSTVGATTSYGLAGLASSKVYSVEVTSWNATGQSPASSCVAFTTLNGPPPAPTGAVISGISYTVATLTWVQATGGGIVNNTVYLYGGTVCTGTAVAFSTAGAKTTYGFTLLVSGTPYATDVTAWNATGQGAPSSCVTFTTTASVVIPPLPTQSYTWVWLLILLAAVPLVATLLYKMGQPGAGFIGGAERRRERREKRRGGGSRRPLLASGDGGGRFSWPSLRPTRFSDAAERFRDATSGAARKLGDATAGARDRIAQARYRLERRRRGR